MSIVLRALQGRKFVEFHELFDVTRGQPVLVVTFIAMLELARECLLEITQAENGEEALAAYRAGKADVMFLDLTMPVMDGYEVLEHLQKESLNTFVVVISADIQPEAQERVKKLGAMAFIKKPVKTESIMAVLEEYGLI